MCSSACLKMVSHGEISHPCWFSLRWGSVSSTRVSAYDGVVTYQQKEVAPCTLLLYLMPFSICLTSLRAAAEQLGE